MKVFNVSLVIQLNTEFKKIHVAGYTIIAKNVETAEAEAWGECSSVFKDFKLVGKASIELDVLDLATKLQDAIKAEMKDMPEEPRKLGNNENF